MAKERTIQSALDNAKLAKLPAVDSYFDRVYQSTYSARWSGYANGMIMGLGVGTTLGLIAAYVPAMLGTGGLPDLGMVGQAMALFAGAGAFTGAAICREAGAAAGAVSAGFEEFERRAKLEKIREQNPKLATEIEHAIVERAALEKPRSRFDQFREFITRAVNWPLVGIGLAVGAAIGAIIAVSPITINTLQLEGSIFAQSALGAKIATGAALGALTGGVYVGFQGALVSNVLSNSTRRVLTGAAFEKDPTPARTKAVAAALEQPEAQELMLDEPKTYHASTFSSSANRISASKFSFSEAYLAEKTLPVQQGK